MKDSPPQKYEDLTRLIHEQHDDMPKAYQAIALYITQNPREVAMLSMNKIAKQCGTHPSNFVRFAQSLGFEGFKELRTLFQAKLATPAPGFEARQQALGADLDSKTASGGQTFLSRLVNKDILSLNELLSEISEEDLNLAAEILDKADVVYILGQLRSAPVADLARYMLTMLGKRVTLLDASGGLSTHMAKRITKDDALLAVSFRFYANEVVDIVAAAGARKVPVIGISDSSLSPIAKNANPLFVVPEREYTFSRSLAAPICLTQALMLYVAARQQRGDDPRIPTVTDK